MADQFSRMYDVERVGGDQRYRLAEMLRANALNQPQGQMVSGWYVPPSWSQNLNTALSGALGTYMGVKLDQEQKEKVADFLKRYEQGKEMPQEPVMQNFNRIEGVEGQTPFANQPAQTELQRVMGRQPIPVEGQTPATQALAQPRQAQPQYRPWNREEKENMLMEAYQIDPRMAGVLGARYDRDLAREEARARMEYDRQTKIDLARENLQGRMDLARIAAGNRQEPLVAVVGKDGSAQLVPRSQAVGMTPFNAQTSGTGAGTPGARQREATEAVDIVLQAAPLIRQSTASGIGAGVDWTAGMLFGASPKGADVAAQLKVLGGALVSKMPKMSGPQSDKDVQLYKDMAGRIGDPTVPTSQKEAALQTIYNLNAKYAGLPEQTLSFEPSVMSGYGAPPAGAVREKK